MMMMTMMIKMVTMMTTMMMMTTTMTMAIYLQYLLCLFLASNSGKLFVSPLIDPHTAPTLMMMMMVIVTSRNLNLNLGENFKIRKVLNTDFSKAFLTNCVLSL